MNTKYKEYKSKNKGASDNEFKNNDKEFDFAPEKGHTKNKSAV
jgi:hypothetical protein